MQQEKYYPADLGQPKSYLEERLEKLDQIVNEEKLKRYSTSDLIKKSQSGTLSSGKYKDETLGEQKLCVSKNTVSYWMRGKHFQIKITSISCALF